MKDANNELIILNRFYEYCKYLYEEEKDRKNSIHNAVKVYITFLTFILGVSIFKAFNMKELSSIFKDDGVNHIIVAGGISLFIVAIAFFFISFIFTILILKVWRFERLCDPKLFALKTVLMVDENEILRNIISDYIVASNRNHSINDTKAKLLSRALFFMITGLFLFAISMLTLNGITFIRGVMQ